MLSAAMLSFFRLAFESTVFSFCFVRTWCVQMCTCAMACMWESEDKPGHQSSFHPARDRLSFCCPHLVFPLHISQLAHKLPRTLQSHRKQQDYRHSRYTSGFYMGTRDLNSRPYTCQASTFTLNYALALFHICFQFLCFLIHIF